MKILEQKIGCFGWNVWLVLGDDGFYKIGLVDSSGDLYLKYFVSDKKETIEKFWENC